MQAEEEVTGAGNATLKSSVNSTTELVRHVMSHTPQGRLRAMAMAMRQEQMAARDAALARIRKLRQEAHDAPNTWMGGTIVPLIIICTLAACIANSAAPLQVQEVRTVLVDRAVKSRLGQAIRAALGWARRRGWTVHDVTRICVSVFFLHEGLAVLELKWTQLEEAARPVWTPFGFMRGMPSWEKGDAQDMVVLVTATATASNLLPEIGLVLLLVDVVTDTLDLVVRIVLTYVVEGGLYVNELTAKKLSLLGVMVLVSTYRWRAERALIAERATLDGVKRGRHPPPPVPCSGDSDERTTGLPAAVAVAVPSLLLLIGRLLMAFVFFYAAGSELFRLLVPMRLADLDPNDPHNIVWPKLVELFLAIPFCLGWRTVLASRALAVTLAVEALTCWQFWYQADQPVRLHASEHFAVNVALAGGLLLVQEVGGGKYAFDELLKKTT